jgi:hypothetical protein
MVVAGKYVRIIWNPNLVTFSCIGILMEIFMNDPSIRKFREWRCYFLSREYPRSWHFAAYQSWYLTPCCGLEVRKPTQALQSVKCPANTFDWSPKWARTLPSLIYFSWDIYRDPPPQKKIQISKLIFDTLLWAWGAETPPSIKGPVNTFDWSPKWARTLPSLIYFSWYIYRVPPPQNKIQISKLIFDTLLWTWGAETHPGT